MKLTIERLNFFASGMIVLGGLLSVVFALQAVVWYFDDEVPFEVIGYTPSIGSPGEDVVILVRVKRDVQRNCSVDFSRYFYDSRGTRFDTSEGERHMNASAIAQMDAANPGILQYTFRIPEAASLGTGKIITSLDYVCNPLHKMYPIQVLSEFSVIVQN